MNKFRSQGEYDCQLVAAINARIYLGGTDVSEDEYKDLCILVKCQHGAALAIEKSYPILGLSVKNGPVKDMPLDWVANNLPVEIAYGDPKFGHHSALVIDVAGNEVLLVNAAWPVKKWSEIYFYPHDHNRKLKTFKLVSQK